MQGSKAVFAFYLASKVDGDIVLANQCESEEDVGACIAIRWCGSNAA